MLAVPSVVHAFLVPHNPSCVRIACLQHLLHHEALVLDGEADRLDIYKYQVCKQHNFQSAVLRMCSCQVCSLQRIHGYLSVAHRVQGIG